MLGDVSAQMPALRAWRRRLVVVPRRAAIVNSSCDRRAPVLVPAMHTRTKVFTALSSTRLAMVHHLLERCMSVVLRVKRVEEHTALADLRGSRGPVMRWWDQDCLEGP